jgi:hypothetical protein
VTAERPLVRGRIARVASAATLVCLVSGVLGPAEAASAVTAAQGDQEAREVRSILTDEFGVQHPRGVAYVPADGTLLVSEARDGAASVLRLTPDEDPVGTFELPAFTQATLSFDPVGNRLAALTDSELLTVPVDALGSPRPEAQRTALANLGLKQPRGTTFDPTTGTLIVLDRRAREVVAVDGGTLRSPKRISLAGLDTSSLQGAAFNPGDGLLYVLSPAESLLYGLDATGQVRATIDVESLALKDPRAILFAPSADPTDDPAALHLFVTDAGDASTFGRVVEATLGSDALGAQFRQLTDPTPVGLGGDAVGFASATAAAAPVVSGTLVKTIQTSQFNPPSPDPAGITYLPSRDRLEISDSEVEEMPIFQGKNLFEITRAGGLTGTGVTTAYTKEPTGLGFKPSDGTLFISDDNPDKVFLVRPGGDGRYGTSDDLRSNISTSAFGSTDPEDVAYDTNQGHLFVSDGLGREVYDVNPVNGIFGDGNDVVTHFDVAQYGVLDNEGIDLDAPRDAIVLADRAGKRVYELTRSGALTRTITLAAASPKNIADVVVAKSSSGTTRNYWIVDRMVDNNTDPNENDGRLYEISAPSSDSPPTVTITSPANGARVAGTVTITANASDDKGVTQVQFFDGTTSIGTDTNGADGWSVSWNTTTTADGAHTIKATATDTVGQTANHTIDVTVDNVDSPPSVTITSPANGATVAGTVTITANASDDRGVTQVQFFDGIIGIGTDTNGADGWSVSWDTRTALNGSHQLTARASDTAGNTTTSAPVQVTVANSAGTGVLDIPVAASLDDVEERANGRVWTATSDLDLMTDSDANVQRAVGLRFTGVSVPTGAVIQNAYVQFQTDEVSSDPTSLTVKGEASDNAAPFPAGSDPGTGVNFNVTSRPVTTASVGWSPAAWTRVGERGLPQQTPNLGPVLQELVSRSGWSSGNAVVLVITGTGRRCAESFDGTFAPVLHIEYATL